MNLYRVEYDYQPYFVEAPSFSKAIEIWEAHAKSKEIMVNEDQEPELVALIHDEPVIRYVENQGTKV